MWCGWRREGMSREGGAGADGEASEEGKRGRDEAGEVFVLVSEGDGGDWAAAGDAGGPVHCDSDAAEDGEGGVRAAEEPGRRRS